MVWISAANLAAMARVASVDPEIDDDDLLRPERLLENAGEQPADVLLLVEASDDHRQG